MGQHLGLPFLAALGWIKYKASEYCHWCSSVNLQLEVDVCLRLALTGKRSSRWADGGPAKPKIQPSGSQHAGWMGGWCRTLHAMCRQPRQLRARHQTLQFDFPLNLSAGPPVSTRGCEQLRKEGCRSTPWPQATSSLVKTEEYYIAILSGKRLRGFFFVEICEGRGIWHQTHRLRQKKGEVEWNW